MNDVRNYWKNRVLEKIVSHFAKLPKHTHFSTDT